MWILILSVIITTSVSNTEGDCRFPDDLQGYWLHNAVTERQFYNFTAENLLLSKAAEQTEIINEHKCVFGVLPHGDDLYMASVGSDQNEYSCVKLQPQANVLFLWDDYQLNINDLIADIGSENETKCSSSAIADLVFVVDTSGSICDGSPRTNGACENWFDMLAFASEIVESLDVGPNGTRVGFVSFGSSAYTEFYLKDHTDKEDIKTAISNVPYRDEDTNIAAGIEMMHEEHFQPEQGDRPNIHNIAIVITDGQSRLDVELTIQNAANARADDITIFAIGVTSNINENELQGISSPPQLINRNYFLTPNFAFLSSILQALVQETCVSAGGELKKCLTRSLDVVMTIDTAEIFNDTQWQSILDFTSDMIVEISSVSFISVRLGFLLYSTDVYYATHLDQFDTTEELLEELKNQDYVTGSRSTSLSFRMINMDIFSHSNGDRDFAPDVVIMLTHGTSNMDANRTLHDAFALRSRDVHVYTVAVTSAVNVYEVKYMSSYPHMEDSSYWFVNQFSDLAGVVSPLMDQLCDDFSLDGYVSVDPQLCTLASYTGPPKLLNKYPVEESKRCMFANNSGYQMTIRTVTEDLCLENLNSRAIVYDDIMYMESCDDQWELQNEVLWCIDDTKSATSGPNTNEVQYFFKPDIVGIGKYYCSKYTSDGMKTSLSFHTNDEGSLVCSDAGVEPDETARSYTMELTQEEPAEVQVPVIVDSANPNQGPTFGRTSVVLTGRFGETKGSIFLVNPQRRVALNIRSWRSNRITGITQPSDDILGPFKISVSVPGQPMVTSAVTFTYSPNPVILDVFPRTTVVAGGTNLTVVGKNFDYVAQALLYINMERRIPTEEENDYKVINKTTFTSDISDRINDTVIVFKTPPITLPSDYIYLTTSRSKRETDDGNKPLNNQYLGFDADIELDGLLARETLQQQGEPIDLSVYNPYFEKYDGVKKFDSETETIIEIQGGNLTLNLGLEIYEVTLGTEQCNVEEIANNVLFCSPPRVEPPIEDSLATQRQDEPQLMVTVGNAVFSIGYVDYVTKTEFTYYIVGLSVLCVSVIMMLVLWVVCEKLSQRIRKLGF